MLTRAADGVATALDALRSGRDLDPLLVRIHELEDEADGIVRWAVATLFATGIDPMVVIRWTVNSLLRRATRSRAAAVWPPARPGTAAA